MFPDAFEKFISIDDELINKEINKLLHIKKQKQKELEALEEEERLKQIEKRKQELLYAKVPKKSKIHPCSQSVFWCKVDNQKEVFDEWRVFTGLKKSGIYEGKVNKPIRLKSNSACLLTSRERRVPESERRILGAFMVMDDFVGKNCEDGYIYAHPEFRIQLTEKESEKMLFWNYYINKKYPHAMTWDSGVYRYFDNIWMARILRDILVMRKGRATFNEVEEFFEYYCRMNQIDKDSIPEPKGALKQK